jgi:hypothetical protein
MDVHQINVLGFLWKRCEWRMVSSQAMSRALICLLLVLALALASASEMGPEMELREAVSDRANILLVLTDDQPASTV